MRNLYVGVCVLVLAGPAAAAVDLGGTVVVPNSPTTGAAGITLSLTNVSVDDSLQFSVAGPAYLQTNGSYGVNAAGVVVSAGPSGSTAVGGSSPDVFSGFTYGALIATFTAGNFTNTVQVFATNVANGLGSRSPLTTLTYAGTLSSLFAYTGRATTVNGTLRFRVDDSGYDDNSGNFTITQAAATVPEPASWALMIGGFGMIGAGMRRRRMMLSA